MNSQELNETYTKEIQKIKDAYHKHFPNGFFKIGFQQMIGDPTLFIHFGLVGKLEDQSHKIVDNDPMHHKIMGHQTFKKNKKTGEYELCFETEALTSGFMTKPPKDSYLAMGRVKTPFRKSTVNMTGQVKKFKTFFARLAQIVIDNKDNMYHDVKSEYLEVNL